jgi:tetratricopeptide (TPR) repeat protein
MLWLRRFLLSSLVLTIFSCAGLGIKSDSREAFDRGLSLFNLGRYDEAVSDFEKAIEYDPEFAKAYLYLGRSYINTDRWIDAIAPLRTAFRLSPEEAKKEVLDVLIDALMSVALSEMKKGNYESALDLLKDILNLDPQSSRVREEMISGLIALGGVLIHEGKYDRAVEVFMEALDLSPNNISAYIGLAEALLRNGDFLRAFKAVRNALRMDPANTEAEFLLKEILGR